MTVGRRLNYGHMMQKAMRSVMAEVLSTVAEEGLPDDHHFYISFETGHPGVDIPDWLRESYPEEMTIVLQEWFDDLAVTPDRFSVTLNFADRKQTLAVPFAAVRTFVDPSAKFGLKFDAYDADETQLEDLPHKEEEEPEARPEPQKPGSGADVVSLDRFRKH